MDVLHERRDRPDSSNTRSTGVVFPAPIGARDAAACARRHTCPCRLIPRPRGRRCEGILEQGSGGAVSLATTPCTWTRSAGQDLGRFRDAGRGGWGPKPAHLADELIGPVLCGFR